MRILLLSLGILFASELEVQGDLKVSGSIDAQNNPVKNVGVPQSLTDAINGNVLQDALRDDTNYDYKFIYVNIAIEGNYIWSSGFWVVGENALNNSQSNTGNSMDDFDTYLTNHFNDGWKLDSVVGVGGGNVNMGTSWFILKRPVVE